MFCLHICHWIHFHHIILVCSNASNHRRKEFLPSYLPPRRKQNESTLIHIHIYKSQIWSSSFLVSVSIPSQPQHYQCCELLDSSRAEPTPLSSIPGCSSHLLTCSSLAANNSGCGLLDATLLQSAGSLAHTGAHLLQLDCRLLATDSTRGVLPGPMRSVSQSWLPHLLPISSGGLHQWTVQWSPRHLASLSHPDQSLSN